MALENFIPEIWSSRLLSNLNKALVYGNVVNRDYEGEIKAAGDTVRINSIGRITVSDYTKNTDHAAPETLTDAQQLLLIDQQKMYNFQLDDIDAAQQKPKVMDEAMREAGYALADVQDQFIAALHTGVKATNVIGDSTTPQVPSATAGDTVYDYLVDMGVMLDENNIPSDGRFFVCPSWVHAHLLKDDRFVKYTSGAEERLKNGKVGSAANFDIRMSNNVPNTDAAKYKCLAGHKMAISFAAQITKTEAYRPQLRFADAVKGLSVYGAKLVRPEAICVATFSKS